MENKYNNSKIYKIEPIFEYEEGDIYIGSTSNEYLSERMAEHRKSYRSWKKGVSKKTMVFDLFDKYGLDFCQTTFMRREVNIEGKSRSFINDTPVSLAILKEFASYLIDIHTQNQTISILNSKLINLLLNFSYLNKYLLQHIIGFKP